MDITSEALEWDSNDTVNFRNFLKTSTGSRFIPKLAEGLPLLLPGGEMNAILIRSGELRGSQELIKTILALAYPPAEIKQNETGYHDLTDDQAWQDGQTIQTPTPK